MRTRHRENTINKANQAPYDEAAFASARGAPFSTPRWHWALSAREHRFVPEKARDAFDAVVHGLFTLRITLPRRFSFSRALSWLDCSAAEERRQKARFAGLGAAPINSPMLWLRLADQFEDPFALRVHVFRSEVVRYWLILTKDNKPLGYAYREVRLDQREAIHHLITFVEGERGDGHGAQVVANAVLVYSRLGIERVRLTAGLSTGSAAWPKMGYRPANRAQWEDLKATVMRNVTAMPSVLHETFVNTHGRTIDEAVANTLATDDPQGVFDIVDIDQGGRAGKAANLRHGYAGVLLNGGHWDGVLDLKGEGRQRLEEYLQTKCANGVVALPPDWPSI